jgi:hypothetical protein
LEKNPFFPFPDPPKTESIRSTSDASPESGEIIVERSLEAQGLMESMEIRKAEVRSILKGLGALRLAELLPPDVEAIQHIAEHVVESGTSCETGDVFPRSVGASTSINSEDVDVGKAIAKWKMRRIELDGWKVRLRNTLDAAGFTGIAI